MKFLTCCCCFGDVLNFNESRSYKDCVNVGSSNINARADNIDCGLRLVISEETLFVRCVIVVEGVGDGDAFAFCDVDGFC